MSAPRPKMWPQLVYRQPLEKTRKTGGRHLETTLFRPYKRFSDAELSAEFWKTKSVMWRRAYDALNKETEGDRSAGRYARRQREKDKECAVLHRFATTPHYDEVRDG